MYLTWSYIVKYLNKDCYSYLASHTGHRASLAMRSSGWLWRFKSLEGLWVEDLVPHRHITAESINENAILQRMKPRVAL